jgi:hypothetical protein
MRELEVITLGARASVDDAFARGLQSCYREHGVDAVAKVLPASQRKHVRLVVVRDSRGELLGGARIHAHRGIEGFPAERALAAFPEASRRWSALAHDGAVELAAMWTAPIAKRTGLARAVAQASIACATAMGKRTALTFSHQFFEHVLFPIGLRPLPGVAAVPFPTAKYRSRVYAAELGSLRDATVDDRALIDEMVACFSLGMDALALEQTTAIEQGLPSFTIRTNRAMHRAAS